MPILETVFDPDKINKWDKKQVETALVTLQWVPREDGVVTHAVSVLATYLQLRLARLEEEEAAKAAKEEKTFDGFRWSTGVAGSAGVVCYDGEDIRLVLSCSAGDAARIVRSHNESVAASEKWVAEHTWRRFVQQYNRRDPVAYVHVWDGVKELHFIEEGDPRLAMKVIGETNILLYPPLEEDV